jgi:hypothetical protein
MGEGIFLMKNKNEIKITKLFNSIRGGFYGFFTR